MCDNKLERVAWIILLFPFLIIGFLVLYSTSVGLISAVRGGRGFSVGAGHCDKKDDGDGFSVGAGGCGAHKENRN